MTDLPLSLLTDRERVELTIPARLYFALIAARCFSEQEKDLLAKLDAMILTACTETIEDLPPAEHAKLGRRIDRIAAAILKGWEQRPALAFGMALFYFLEDLLAREVLILWEGSAFAGVMDLLLPMMAHGFETEELDRTAREDGRQILERLRRAGYYQGAA